MTTGNDPGAAGLDGLAMRTGIDLVRLEEFSQSRKPAGGAFDHRLFTPEELEDAAMYGPLLREKSRRAV